MTYARESPTASAEPSSFEAMAAGRAALVDDLYVLATMPRLNVSTRWTLLYQDEDHHRQLGSGTESLTFERATNRLLLICTRDDTGSTTRYTCDGHQLLVTRFAPNSSPARSANLFSIDSDGTNLAQALAATQTDDMPLSSVARAALLGPSRADPFRVSNDVYLENDHTVLEQSAENEPDGHVPDSVRRYRFGATHLPLEIQEWISRPDGNQHASPIYREEQFTYTPSPTRTDPFSVKPPAAYAVIAPTGGATPATPLGPDPVDTRSLALLTRWRMAWARFTSYKARVRISETTKAQTAESPAPDSGDDREAVMDVQYQRSGKLYVYSRPAEVPSSFKLKQTLVSNGKKLVVFENGGKRGDADNPSEDSSLHDAARNTGFWDFSEALARIMENPQLLLNDAEQATYQSVLPVPGGGSAEAVRITRSFTDNGVRRRGTPGVVTMRQTITIYFDPESGLPVRSEFVMHRLSTDTSAQAKRDLPPDEYRSANFENIRLNQAIPDSVFDLNKAG